MKRLKPFLHIKIDDLINRNTRKLILKSLSSELTMDENFTVLPTRTYPPLAIDSSTKPIDLE